MKVLLSATVHLWNLSRPLVALTHTLFKLFRTGRSRPNQDHRQLTRKRTTPYAISATKNKSLDMHYYCYRCWRLRPAAVCLYDGSQGGFPRGWGKSNARLWHPYWLHKRRITQVLPRVRWCQKMARNQWWPHGWKWPLLDNATARYKRSAVMQGFLDLCIEKRKEISLSLLQNWTFRCGIGGFVPPLRLSAW